MAANGDVKMVNGNLKHEAEMKCGECCGEDAAVTFCTDCTLFLCQLCNEHHKRSIKSRGHSIVPINEAIQPKPKVMTCRKHDFELLFYCETCDHLVCMYCTVKDHIGHTYDTVKKVVVEHREELKKVIAPVEEMIKGLSDAHDNIDKMRKKIIRQGDEVKKKIDQHYDKLIQQLIEQKQELNQQAHDTVSQKVKAITTQLEEVEHVQAEMLSIKKLNDALEKSSDQEVLSVKKQLIDRMQQITDEYKKVNIPPVQEAKMKFVPSNEAFPTFGLVLSTVTYNFEVVDPPRYAVKGKQAQVTMVIKDDNGDRCSEGSKVSVRLGGVSDTTHVRDNNDGSYVASFVPQEVGEMKLSVFVNGHQIIGSPYSVMVKDYALVLNKPSKILNNNDKMGKPWSIAFSKNGTWAVTDYSNHCVYIFDDKDQLVRKFGSKGTNNGQFDCPAGVAFDSDDHLYVTDRINHRVQKFTSGGKYLLQFGSEGSADANLKYPRGLAVHNQKVYVTEVENKRISVFQMDGKFHHIIASGQLGSPYDVAVNGNDQLLVADEYHHCIYTFTLDGDYVGRFDTLGTSWGDLKNPHGITVDLYGFILVANTYYHCVSIFDEEGVFLNSYGSRGSAVNQVQFPYGIAVNANGDIYVTDHENYRIVVFYN